jgi:hypothetical protein
MQKEVTSHVTKGLLAVLILIVYDLAAQFLGFKYEGWNGLVWAALLLGMLIWGCINYGTQMNDNVTFGKVFTYGFKMTAVIICIWFVYTLLTVYVIFPNMLDEMWEKGVEQARKRPDFNEERFQQGAAIGRKVMKAFVFVGALLIPLILGVVGALVGAAIAKKRPVPADFENA